MPCHVLMRWLTQSGVPGPGVAVAGFLTSTLSNACSYFGSGTHRPCGALCPMLSENGRRAVFSQSIARSVTTCE